MKIIYHYELEYTEPGGDYTYVTVEKDGVQIAIFGDDYHDKGVEKAQGFIEGWYAALGQNFVEPEYEERTFGQPMEEE